jgi:hypothetical protein
MIGISSPAGDLDISGQTIDGIAYAVQKIDQTLKMLLGEWFIDTALGIPWVESILVKNPSFEYIRGVLRRAILSVPGVVDVPYLTVTEPDATRTATCTYRAIYKDGTELTGTVETGVI